MDDSGAMRLDPDLFAGGPARDARFVVKDHWNECSNLDDDDPERVTEFLHRQMNEEINSMECAARMLTDFPGIEWELQMCIASQCYDEARHVEMFRSLYEARGGRVGGYPVLNFQYRIITNVADFHGRLAVQNRTFESEGVDAVEPEIRAALVHGDYALAQLFDAQLADEIGHVRFANAWINRAVSEDPSAVMRIGRALDSAARAFFQVMGQHAIDGADYEVNRAGRLEAGFSKEEVELAEDIRAKRRISRLAREGDG